MNIHRQIFRHIGLFLLLFCGITNWALALECNKQEQGQWTFQDSLENLKLYGLSNNLFYLKATLPDSKPYLIFETTATSCDIFYWPYTPAVAVRAAPYGDNHFQISNDALFKPLEILQKGKARYTYQLPSFKQVLYEVTIELTPFSTKTPENCKPTFTPDATGYGADPWLTSSYPPNGVPNNPLWMRASDLKNCDGYKLQINLKAFQTVGTSPVKSCTTGLFYFASVSLVQSAHDLTLGLPFELNYYGAHKDKNLISWLDAPISNYEGWGSPGGGKFPPTSGQVTFDCPRNNDSTPTPTPPPIPPSPEKKCQVVVKSAVRRR
jgi:hypothetical protein